ncbi:MAG: hypothetical protein UT90_C0017G0002 [Parcubacteria group bacterium GW2011_GWA1_40_21]|nr:MAG: hypothetical protein UT90_C0017G0002 [Parcubacteria group bacterium GW2011_GWA1_40_21]
MTESDYRGYNYSMKNIIQFSIEKGQDGYYTASANDFAIVTQAKNFEDLIKNIREATELHFEEVLDEEKSISQNPSIFINYEIPISLYA